MCDEVYFPGPFILISSGWLEVWLSFLTPDHTVPYRASFSRSLEDFDPRTIYIFLSVASRPTEPRFLVCASVGASFGMTSWGYC